MSPTPPPPPHPDDDQQPEPGEHPNRSERLKESASRIWLAGLGALARAPEEGGKAFEHLVREGQAFQRKTQSAAGEKFGDAGSRMAQAAAGLSGRAAGQWEKMESALEERLLRRLQKLGVPTMEEFDALRARVAELEQALDDRDGFARREHPPGQAPGPGAPRHDDDRNDLY